MLGGVQLCTKNYLEIRIDNKLGFFLIKPTMITGLYTYMTCYLFDFDNKRSCDFHEQKGLNNGFFYMDGFEIISSERAQVFCVDT